ncbi:MAG: lysophospholipid acyltransferase family protein [Pyrinomonadaceae bacterium]
MGKHGKVQTFLEYAVARAVIGGLGLLPRPAAVAVGRTVGHAAYALAGRLRRAGEINLRLAFPELDQREHERILRGTFDSLGRLLGEFSQFPRATSESMRRIVEYDSQDVKLLEVARERGRGVIFLTSHLGAWEVLSFAHSAMYEPLSFLVRPIDNPRVEDLVEGIRTRFGNRPIAKNAAARAALKILREGGTLGILADLNTQRREGVFVPFFGHLACTTSSVAVLALRTDATVIPACAVWEESRQRFVFRGGPILELIRTGDAEQDLLLNTAQFTAALERQIRAYPEQWLWIHKRWRTRPEGEPDFYAKNNSDDKGPKVLTKASERSI